MNNGYFITGTDTDVGKTWATVTLMHYFRQQGRTVAAMKPVASGCVWQDGQWQNADALLLQHHASSPLPYPLINPYANEEPVSPHLAARSIGIALQIGEVAGWVREAEAALTTHVSSPGASFTVIETAGGVFTPLSMSASNFDLARALEPAIWVLVAADALGVLHDVSATLQAMTARGRPPDHLLLSSAREPDASTGTNALELATLGIAAPIAVLARNDDRAIGALVDRLLAGSDEQAR